MLRIAVFGLALFGLLACGKAVSTPEGDADSDREPSTGDGGSGGSSVGDGDANTNGSGGEGTVPCADGCLIDGECHENGRTNPENECEICNADDPPDSWKRRPNGTPCDDGKFCTARDTCQRGICEGVEGQTPCSESEVCAEDIGECCAPQDALGCGATDDVASFDSCGREEAPIVEDCHDTKETCVSATCECAPGWFDVDCNRCRLFVDQATGDDTNPGTSWTDAFWSLNTALQKAASNVAAEASLGCEIWVAEGTYYPEGKDQLATFQMVSGVDLYGGFAGNEDSPAERILGENETILSGDLNEDGLPNDGDSYHVVVSDTEARMNRITVRDGFAGDPTEDSPHRSGAGLQVLDGFVTLEECVFEHNVAAESGGAVNKSEMIGGAILLKDSHINMTRTVFNENTSRSGGAIGLVLQSELTASDCYAENNIAESRGGVIDAGEGTVRWTGGSFHLNTATHGGAIRAARDASVILNGASFKENSADEGGAVSIGGAELEVVGCEFNSNRALRIDGDGGAIYFSDAASVRIYESSFENNSLPDQFLTRGGAIGGSGQHLELVSSTFTQNSAYAGGAVFANMVDSGGVLVDDCLFEENTATDTGAVSLTFNVQIANSRFVRNKATSQSGALSVASALVVNSLVTGNSADVGAVSASFSDPTFLHSTFTNNFATTEGGVFSTAESAACEFEVVNSVLWGNTAPTNPIIDLAKCAGAISYSNVQGGFAGDGNIDSDPLFTDPSNDDYTLLPTSPCVDAADANLLVSDLWDLDNDGDFDEP